VVPCHSLELPILFPIHTSRLINMVKEQVSEAEALSVLDDLRRVAAGSTINHVSLILERRTTQSIEWASGRGLQFDTAKTEAALYTHRRGHRNHIRRKLTAMIQVSSGVIRFKIQLTCWQGVWMDAHPSFKE